MFRAWRVKIRSFLTSQEIQDQAAKLKEAFDIQLYAKRQAEVDSLEGETVANLVQSLEHVESACITVGSLAILKYTGNGGPMIHVRQLTAAEMRALAKYPDLHKHPEKFFQSLDEATQVISVEPADE